MFRKRLWVLCGLLLLTMLATQTLWADSSFAILQYTFSNAGGQLESSNFVLRATFGQPSVGGELDGEALRLKAGFLAGEEITPTPTHTPTSTNTPTNTSTHTPTATHTPSSTPGPGQSPTPEPASHKLYIPMVVR